MGGASGVVDALTIEGTSFWFYVRLRHWMWLEEQLLWLALVDDRRVRDRGRRPSRWPTAAMPGSSRRRGPWPPVTASAFRGPHERGSSPAEATDRESSAAPPAQDTADAGTARPVVAARLRRWRGPDASDPPTELAAAGRSSSGDWPTFAAGRCSRVGSSSSSSTPAQRVETPDGPRWMNAYLGPIADRLRGTALDPIEVEIRARVDDDAGDGTVSRRPDPRDAARRRHLVDARAGGTPRPGRARAEAAATAIDSGAAPLVAFGVDLGPVLGGAGRRLTRACSPARSASVGRLRSLIARLLTDGVLLADEYHRQDWLTAARPRASRPWPSSTG